MYEVAIDDLKKVFEDFYNLTKFMIVLYDSDRNALFSYPDEMCEFCRTVRACPKLLEKCLQCDQSGFDVCDQTRKPYIYECHMSVIEAIAPIYSGEMNMGYLMFGQIATYDKEKIRACAEKVSQLYGINLSDDMISKITVSDEKYIASAVNMMTMCANYLYTNQIIKNNPDILVYQLKEYIAENIGGDLSCENICQQFFISPSKLYKISKKNFGTGISDYVRSERIKKAKKLLDDTEYPVAQIADSVGIPDNNYFIRFFKRVTGMTPLRYRNKKKHN